MFNENLGKSHMMMMMMNQQNKKKRLFYSKICLSVNVFLSLNDHKKIQKMKEKKLKNFHLTMPMDLN